MNKLPGKHISSVAAIIAAACLALFFSPSSRAQTFDFSRLDNQIEQYTVVINMEIEFSFGMQSNNSEQRLLGTVVSEDGLVIFDGSFLSDYGSMAPIGGMSFKTTPKGVEIKTLDNKTFEADYVGVDRFTGLGFVKITDATEKFKPVKFVKGYDLKVGQWVALHMLLPDHVDPPLSADVGMVSSLIKSPYEFALIVGFSPIELGSIIFNDRLQPIGVLGRLNEDSSPSSDQGSMDGFGRFDLPLLGVIPAEKVEKLIADPPEKGKVDRAWLGITLQALTPDIAEFLEVDAKGGIIVNEVVKESPADHAGLKVGDVIYSLNSQPIEVDREEEVPIFQRKISEMGAGTSVEIAIYRPADDGLDSLTVLAVLEAAPMEASDAEEDESEDLEFKVRDLVFADFFAFGVEQGSLNGVVVSELKNGGLAYISGLQIGDVIQQIDGREVTSVEDAQEALEQISETKPTEVVLFIWRFSKTLFVNLKTDWPEKTP